ncbi:MAG: NYN domain-containing protein [Chloroflexi bacterium]|nr:NYN domain-containing protein [Chloroflexota bacterium]
MAVFIDYENMVLCAREERFDFSLDPIMEVLRARGRPVLVRAYGDWGAYPQYPRDLRTHAVDLIQLYRYGVQQKNRADIALAVHAMDALYRLPHIEVFVIVAGDGDYAPLASKLRENGRRVVGIGIRGSTSPLLVASCDEFLYYDALVARMGLALEPLDVLDLVEKALRALQQLGETAVTADRLRQVMVGLDPSFVASPFVQQHGSFDAFLSAHPERVQVHTQNGILRFSLPSAAALASGAVARPGSAPVDGPSAPPAPTAARVARGPLHARYRQTLQKQGWMLLNPDDRRGVLRKIYEELKSAPPGHTMAAVVETIADRYERLGMAIARHGVEEAARAAWRSGLLEPTGEVWHVGGPAALREEPSSETFVTACERIYLETLRSAHGELDLEAAAQVLFGDARRKEEVNALLAAPASPPLRDTLPYPSLRMVVGDQAYELVGATIEEALPPGTAVSAQEARVLFEKGQEQRSRDFVAGARTLLLASRIQWYAIQQGDFGASIDDLRWYVASGLSAEAGARYISREYEAAVPYYLAYFSMLRRSDRLWEDVSRLTIPMLSYYTILATRLEGQPDPASPNAGQPGYLVALVATHEDDRVIWRWQQLASRLAQASPSVFEELMRRIESSSADPETIRRTVEWMSDLAQRV